MRCYGCNLEGKGDKENDLLNINCIGWINNYLISYYNYYLLQLLPSPAKTKVL